MALDFLRLGDCTLYGPALPEPYVRFELEKALAKHKLLPDVEGLTGQKLRDEWDIFRRKLRDVSPNSGPVAITNRILDPLVSRLGYAKVTPADTVLTREGDEAGGLLMSTDAGAKLRCWAIDYDADLDAPTQRGYAYRFSPVRIAQRVLLATDERLGLITIGVELRLLLCDPARPESHVEIDLNVWRLSRDLPDGYQLLLALASPTGIAALPEIIEDARLKQNKVTKELRVQARRAVEQFVQSVLDHPDNTTVLAGHTDKAALAKALWHEGLIVVYRLLFVLKCESTSDPSRVFRFASTPLWRNTYSPSIALARTVRRVLDEGATSGRYLEDGLRVLFRLFAEGLDHPGLTVRPLGGALFGAQSTPMLSSLRWGELAVAHLLDRLLWSDTRRGRERVHYGPLDVEDLGRVYEALLELEPGIAVEPMCRLRRQKLEVVVPAEQGDKYKTAGPAPAEAADDASDGDEDEAEEEPEDDKPARGKKTKVEWIEKIPPGRFYLRVGLGRKSTGSFYTPHSFVRFLVQETLGPQCDQRSPRDNPDPGAILKLKVLDPACGSGHFLVEACRFLAARVYEAARLCDELATKAEHDTEAEKNAARKQALVDRAAELRQRLRDLPDQEDELLSYLPSRSAGAEKAVLSAHDIARAEAICRRLVAVHCIYGADLNPLAVELAKLSLWIESHAEGFPLTFLDHRIVLGNSLTGPFWDKLNFAPGSQQPVSDLFRQNLDLKLAAKLGEALSLVKELESSVGVDVRDIAVKQQFKEELDARLLPFRTLAAAWSGGVMLGTDQPDGQPRCDDDAYADLLKHVGTTGALPASIDIPNLRAMIDKGRLALPFDLAFPEVFHPTGQPHGRLGFDAVLGNPPWDQIEIAEDEFWAYLDIEAIASRDHRERAQVVQRLKASPSARREWDAYQKGVAEFFRSIEAQYEHQQAEVDGSHTTGRPDLFRLFGERMAALLAPTGAVGVVLPSAFHGNEGATGLRRLYLQRLSLRCCYSFENRRKLFEIHLSFKFALVVASRGGPTTTFYAAFYLRDDAWLYSTEMDQERLKVTADVVNRSFGRHLVFIEARSREQFELATRMRSAAAASWHDFLASAKLKFSNGIECHRRPDTAFPSARQLSLDQWQELCLATDGCPNRVPLPEGKNINLYTLATPFVVEDEGEVSALLASAHWRESLPHFRIGFRYVAASTNERTALGALLPPLVGFANGIVGETAPSGRPDSVALWTLGLLNSFCFDYQVRQQATNHVNRYVLAPMAVPDVSGRSGFLCHAVTRLSCSHGIFEPLWREQLGNAWRESGKAPFTWPVLAGDDERWAVRAAIDAVVADAYGLSREQYAHVLSTFSHASYKQAPDLCLAAFDKLKALGLDAFCKKHDLYHDIPLVETLPKPVIDLPIPSDGDGTAAGRTAPDRKRKGRGSPSPHPVLWEERTGQLTTEPHGPIFDPPPAASGGPDPGKVQAVRTLLEIRKVLTSAEVQQQFGLDTAGARAILKLLVERGLASVEGKAKGIRYRWAGAKAP